MVIIVEGPDGGGKSSLAERLSKATGYEIIHRSKPESEEEKKRMYDSYIDVIKSGKSVIFDRCWYSELVYGRVMRDESVLTGGESLLLETEIASRGGGILIYCTDKPEVLWQRCTSRGEDYITSYKTFLKICEGYDSIMNMHHMIPVVKYGF